MNLESIQSELQKTGLDGWLFLDHHERDPLAYRVLGLKPPGHLSRRWYYFIPARGDARRTSRHPVDVFLGGASALPADLRSEDGGQRLRRGTRRA